MYAVEYSLIPNLAIDLLNRPFCGLVEPTTFLRTTLVLTMAGILFFVWKLHAFLNGRPNAFVLLAPAMTFNLVTSMGYINYLIGTFLFLAFAWVMLRYDVIRRHPTLAIVVPNIFGSLIFLCHIFALALTGVFLFGLRFAAGGGRPLLRRAIGAGLITGASFAIPLLMILLADRSGLGFSYALAGKIRTIWAVVLYANPNPYVPALLAGLWIALLYWAFRERHISIAPALRWPVALLIVFSLLLPSALLNAVDLDARTFVSTAYLTVAAFCAGSVGGERIPIRAKIAAAAVAAVTVAVQLGVLIPQAQAYGAQVAELRQALRVIPPGSSVLSAGDFSRTPPVPHRFYSHLASFTTIDRRAFNALEFTGKGMQPMSSRPDFACVDISASSPIPLGLLPRLLNPGSVKLTDRYGSMSFRYAYLWDRHFDYALYYHYGFPANPAPGHLKPIHSGSFFTIFRTNKPLRARGPCADRPGGARGQGSPLPPSARQR